MRISRSVVLPAPLGPRMPKNSPALTVNETPATARVEPYALWMSYATTAGGAPDAVGVIAAVPSWTYYEPSAATRTRTAAGNTRPEQSTGPVATGTPTRRAPRRGRRNTPAMRGRSPGRPDRPTAGTAPARACRATPPRAA